MGGTGVEGGGGACVEAGGVIPGGCDGALTGVEAIAVMPGFAVDTESGLVLVAVGGNLAVRVGVRV